MSERRAVLRKLVKPDLRCPIQFSDHLDGDGAKFFRAAVDLGLEGIVSKRAASRYRSDPLLLQRFYPAPTDIARQVDLGRQVLDRLSCITLKLYQDADGG